MKFLLVWGVSGLAIPALILLHWRLADSTLGPFEVMLWPSSIMLMGLEGPDPRTSLDIAEAYAIAIAANVILYLLVGLLVSPFVYWVLRWRNRSKVN